MTRLPIAVVWLVVCLAHPVVAQRTDSTEGSAADSGDALVVTMISSPAPGIYVARHMRTDSDGSGWSLQLSYSYGTIRNTPKSPEGDAPTTNRLLLGMGWYQ